MTWAGKWGATARQFLDHLTGETQVFPGIVREMKRFFELILARVAVVFTEVSFCSFLGDV